MKPVYLDTNTLIHLVEREEYGLRSFVRRVNEAGRRLVTSEMTLAELLVKPLREKNESLVALYEDLLSADGIVEAHPADRKTMRRSAKIRALHGGSLPDSIHVATAAMLGCEAIISSDERLKLPDGLVRIPVADLQVEGEGRR